jgi:hypothetical protein
MGIRAKWRAGHMKDPSTGHFQVSGHYTAPPHSSPPGIRLTGVIVAEGMAPTPAEAPADHEQKWIGKTDLPVVVDRADPTNFQIQWDQVIKQDWQAIEQQRAMDAATRMAGGEGALGGGGFGLGGFGGGNPGLVEARMARAAEALRAAGIDPSILNSADGNVHVHISGAGGADQARALLATFGSHQHAGPTVPATGVVRDVHDLPSPILARQGMTMTDIVMDVTRPDGSVYRATTRLGFRTPQRRAAIATPGTTVPLLVDANDPARVSIDVGRMNLP